MESKKEQALVGLFVIVATGLLVFVVFLLSGTLSRGDIPYRAFLKNGGGIGPGAEVHYNGGPPVGRVKDVKVDPNDPSLIEIDFEVKPDIPIKTDSTVIITSNSPWATIFWESSPAAPALLARSAAPPSRPAITPASTTSRPCSRRWGLPPRSS